MANAPATFEASAAWDFDGCLPGHVRWQADAEQAYYQSHLGDYKTWVRLPKDRWPKEWYNEDGVPLYDDPVCPLILALYGHPKPGKYWEDHAEETLMDKLKWKPVPEWKSCYWHEYKCFTYDLVRR